MSFIIFVSFQVLSYIDDRGNFSQRNQFVNVTFICFSQFDRFFIYLFTHPIILLFIFPLSICLIICLFFLCLFIHLFIYFFIYLFTYLFIYLFFVELLNEFFVLNKI